jgi:hypothetical protein
MTPARDGEASSPRGTPTSPVWKDKCPPAVISECSPSNHNHGTITASASLLIKFV